MITQLSFLILGNSIISYLGEAHRCQCHSYDHPNPMLVHLCSQDCYSEGCSRAFLEYLP